MSHRKEVTMSLSYEYEKHERRDILRHAKALEGYVIGDVYELEVLGKLRFCKDNSIS